MPSLGNEISSMTCSCGLDVAACFQTHRPKTRRSIRVAMTNKHAYSRVFSDERAPASPLPSPDA